MGNRLREHDRCIWVNVNRFTASLLPRSIAYDHTPEIDCESSISLAGGMPLRVKLNPREPA